MKEAGGLLKIEDILPFFPDFVHIDEFKDAICSSLEEYNRQIEDLKVCRRLVTQPSLQSLPAPPIRPLAWPLHAGRGVSPPTFSFRRLKISPLQSEMDRATDIADALRKVSQERVRGHASRRRDQHPPSPCRTSLLSREGRQWWTRNAPASAAGVPLPPARRPLQGRAEGASSHFMSSRAPPSSTRPVSFRR